jgi:hypothetical protein
LESELLLQMAVVEVVAAWLVLEATLVLVAGVVVMGVEVGFEGLQVPVVGVGELQALVVGVEELQVPVVGVKRSNFVRTARVWCHRMFSLLNGSIVSADDLLVLGC